MESVRAFGKRWIETGRTLDLLFNNAGLSVEKVIITEDGVSPRNTIKETSLVWELNFLSISFSALQFELTHQVNYLSHCLLTLIVLPSMKDSKAPRIVNTCSAFHNGGVLDFRWVRLRVEVTCIFLNWHWITSHPTAISTTKRKLLEVFKGFNLTAIASYSIWWVSDCWFRSYHKLFSSLTTFRFCFLSLTKMWTRELQSRLSRSDDYRHIIVNGIHPGFVGESLRESTDSDTETWREASSSVDFRVWFLLFLFHLLNQLQISGTIPRSELFPSFSLRDWTLSSSGSRSQHIRVLLQWSIQLSMLS